MFVPEKTQLNSNLIIMSGWIFSKDNETIIKLAKLTRKLILELQISDSENETFEQQGILNGLSIIRDYIDEDEIDLAIEHLLYMVYESDIAYPKEEFDELHTLFSKYKVNNFYTS